MLRHILTAIAVLILSNLSFSQCTKDTDCKGDRICVDGECVEPKAEEEGPEATEESSPAASSSMGKASFYMNVLGIVQFGPIFGTEIGVGPNTFIDLHWRYSSVGLLYALILTEGFQNYMSMGSMAFGGGVRHFIELKGPHRFFIGGFVEYGWGKTWTGELDYPEDEWEGEEAQIVIAVNPGFRFRFNSNFFLNLGLLAGAAIDVKDEWVYIKRIPQEKRTGVNTLPFGMLEFTLGWEFGR